MGRFIDRSLLCAHKFLLVTPQIVGSVAERAEASCDCDTGP